MSKLHHDYCICGKQLVFKNEQQAHAFIKSRKGIELGLIRYYRCREANKVHVTSKLAKSETQVLPRVARELHQEMATVKQFVVDYMTTAYRKNNSVEFTTSEIKKKYLKQFPTGNEGSVATAVFALKKDGVIVDLNKPVPGAANSRASFFTLAKIMEEETKPVSKTVNIPVQPQIKPTPATVANPFDKVNSQMSELLNLVKGLAQGYSELAKRSPEKSDIGQAILDVSRVIIDEQRNNKDLILEKLNKPTPVEIDAEIIAEAVNLKLSDVANEDSMIYRIREEVSEITDRESKWIVENIAVPTDVTNQNDYRAGIKEGIRLSVEMGLMVRDSE